ncbi:MAG: hypothetical protein FLDDKLPJ_01169 [Phycisphaerae bacterium]|nr:hypothetical protein [Phycisphaerae bacterium]
MPVREEGRYTLADNSVATTRLYLGELAWFDQWRRVLIAEMEGDVLLGMAMLQGCHLGIDVVAQGRVEVRALSDGS